MINIEYDDIKIQESEITSLANAVQKIVSEVSAIEDVFVYVNSSQIKVKIAPVEIFIRISEEKYAAHVEMFEEMKEKISQWKKVAHFNFQINLTLIPMHWQVAIDI